MHLRYLLQESLVAHAHELAFLLVGAEPRQVVGLVVALETGDVAARLLAQGRLAQELGPRPAAGGDPRRAGHQSIDAEPLAVEPDAETEAELAIDVVIGRDLALEPIEVDADGLQQTHRHRAVLAGPFDVERAAIEHQHAAAVVELVALGVAAEVVVVVEHQDLRPGASGRAEEERGRKAADAAADDHQVVGLAGIGGGAAPSPIAELVGDLE